MKILQLISSLGYFGAENVLVELSKELVSKGCEVTVGFIYNEYAPHFEVADVAKKYNLNVQIFRCKRQFDVGTIFELRRFISEGNIGIVHSHNYKSNFYSLSATIGLPVKRISTCHNWLGRSNKMRFYTWLDKTLLKRFDRVVAVSGVVKDTLYQSGMNGAKVAVIDNGIDLKKFSSRGDRSRIKEEFEIPMNCKIVGTVGRLTEEKGHIYFIDAAKRVLEKHPETFFIIVGDGPLMESLKDYSGNSHIVFTGIRNDVQDIYPMFDIFVLPSLNEGLPMAILEAMASKNPVIASKIGAIPDVIKPRDSGILVERQDVQQLTIAILKLLENDETRVLLSENGYQWIVNNYSSGKMADNYLELYANTLKDIN